MPPDPTRPAPPRPVRTAVLLMYAGAALSAVSLIVTVLSFHAIERVIRNASSTLTAQQVHNDAIVAVTIAVGGEPDRHRPVAADGLGEQERAELGPDRRHRPVRPEHPRSCCSASSGRAVSISLAFSVLVWLIGLGAIVLLWRKESSEYFALAGPRR